MTFFQALSITLPIACAFLPVVYDALNDFRTFRNGGLRFFKWRQFGGSFYISRNA